MHVNFEEIKADVVGRWPGIFQHYGIKIGDGRHCPCPVCGGKDRFRFDNKDGRGTWICNQCGAGDGWKLLQSIISCDFKEAMKEVAGILGKIKPSSYTEEQKINPEILRKMFKESEAATMNNLVGQYLKNRGLNTCPPVLRYHSKCYDPDTKKKYPTMLAIVTLPNGKAVTLHRTFLDVVSAQKAKIDKPKKLMPGLKKITGSAIRLFQPELGVIGLAEGIETALACTERFGVPTWSTISSTMLESFIVPKGIKKIYIFGDNDENFTGQKSAYSLANRLILRDKIKIEVQIPTKIGTDFLDEHNDIENC